MEPTTAVLRLSPAVTESWIILDRVKSVIEFTKFLPDTFNEGPDIGAIAFRSNPGRKSLATNEVVDISITYVRTRARRHEVDDIEFTQCQRYFPAIP